MLASLDLLMWNAIKDSHVVYTAYMEFRILMEHALQPTDASFYLLSSLTYVQYSQFTI